MKQRGLHRGKVALITGAASGLGFAVAQEMLEEEAKVVLVDIDGEELQAAERKLMRDFPDGEMCFVQADVSREEDVKRYIAKTAEVFGALDCFHNNAGVKGIRAKLADYSSAELDRLLAINLYGAYYGMRYAYPLMKATGGGTIINTTSVYGLLGSQDQAGYIASKHALAGLTKTAANEFMDAGINVIAIAPIGIRTKMLRETLEAMNPEHPEEAMRVFTENNPSKRIASPDEVAGVVSFLFTDRARYINGEVITIDGGTSSRF